MLDKMDSFDFVFFRKFVIKILGVTNTLPKILQVRDQNIGYILNMINVVKIIYKHMCKIVGIIC